MLDSHSSSPQGDDLTNLWKQLARVNWRLDRIERELRLSPPPLPPQPSKLAEPAPAIPSPPFNPQPVSPPPPPQPPMAPSMAAPAAPPSSVPPVPRPAPPITPPISPLPPAPRPATAATTSEPASADRSLDWEHIIGGQWALWVGSLSLFLAVASLLVYVSRQLPPLPMWARVALAFASGLTMIGIGAYTRPRTQRWFSEGITGAGLAICYLTLWIGAHYLDVLPKEPAYFTMGALVAFGAMLAIHYDAFSLSALSTSGGFLTLWLFQDGGSQERVVPFLTYLALLNAGMLAISVFKRWDNLVWGCFLATCGLLFWWSLDVQVNSVRMPFFLFATLFFLLFVGAASFYSLVHEEETADGDLLLLVSATTAYASAGWALSRPFLNFFPATFPLGLALFFGLMTVAVYIFSGRDRKLRDTTFSLSMLALTVAIPIQLRQGSLVTGWSAEAAVLLLLGSRFNSLHLRRAGQIVWLLSLLPLATTVATVPPVPEILFINRRALPLLIATAIGWLLTIESHLRDQENGIRRDEVSEIYACFTVLAGAWLLSQETMQAFKWNHYPSTATWIPGGIFVAASVTSLYAVAVFGVGMKLRHLVLRLTALQVGALACSVPLWTGMAYAPQDWTPFLNLRAMSFGCMAITLFTLGKMAGGEAKGVSNSEREVLAFWPLLLGITLLIGSSLEVYSAFSRWHRPGDTHWNQAAFLSLGMLWCASAGIWAYLGAQWRFTALRGLGYLTAGAATLTIAFESLTPGSNWPPVVNWRFCAFAFCALAWASFTWIVQRNLDKVSEEERFCTTGFALTAVTVATGGISEEIFWTCKQYAPVLGTHWDLTAWFGMVLFWSGLAVGLLYYGIRKRAIEWRQAAAALGIAANACLLLTSLTAMRLDWFPFLNLRFAAFIVVPGCLGIATYLLHSEGEALTDDEHEFLLPAALLAIGLLGWGLTQEVFETCYFFRSPIGAYWERYAQLSISLVWSVYGTLLLLAGIYRDVQALRITALTVLAVTVLKVFLLDLSFLGDSLRILSLAGLGLSLIFISWLYSRFGTGRPHPQ